MSDGYDAFRQVIERYFPGGFTLRDEANAIVAYAFRNGPIEDLHAGKPSPLLDDPVAAQKLVAAELARNRGSDV